MQSATTIGWREWGALPELGITAIRIKADTGAKTSSLHAINIRHFQHDGQPWVRFFTQSAQESDEMIACQAPLIDTRTVKNSGGECAPRPVIYTMLTLGNETWPIEITLADRSNMKFRMLLGRRAMRKRCVVRPEASYLLGKPNAD